MAFFVFWLSMAACAYTYAGYPVLLIALNAIDSCRTAVRFLAGGADRRRTHPAWFPKVSVLIAAHNEAGCIRRTIETTLDLDYPPDKLEIWIGSDGSTDGTDDIVREYDHRGVKLSTGPRVGKSSVLNRLAEHANGSLWLFTDANTIIERGALRALVAKMADPDVGAVCGRLRLVSRGNVTEEGAYWRYESLLKLYESPRGAVIGANGGLYLLRRTDWHPLPAQTVVDDFLITMRVLLAGRRVVYAPDAVAREETAIELTEKLERRVRIAAGNFQSLRELKPLLGKPTFAGFAFWSHKMLRWCAPAFLVGAFVANVALAARWPYRMMLIAQVAFYGLAIARHGTARYFVTMNAGIALGLVRYLRGGQQATWKRTARTAVPPQPS